MTERLKDRIYKYHLQSYTDVSFASAEYNFVEAWEFANIYECVPHYWYYTPTGKEYLEIYELSHGECYDDNKSFISLIKEFEGDSIKHGDTIFTEYGMITDEHIILKDTILPERIKNSLVVQEEVNHFLFASMGHGGFNTKSFPIKEISSDILENYNEDLPVEKFNNFIEDNNSGIALMFGEPGCGKTYFIRYLISQHPNKKFIWFDQSLLTQSTSDAFVKFVIDNKDSILIMEDCEILLKSRDQGNNGIINTVLNIADGIIGDSLNIKFLCTFNTDLTNVDKAITRKGRLKIQYEFKKLTVDKVKNLFNKLGIEDDSKEMPLCDIFNYNTENGNKKKERKKIGF